MREAKGTHDADAPVSSWGDVMLACCGWARLGGWRLF